MAITAKKRIAWNKGKKGTGFGMYPENIHKGDPWNKGKKGLQVAWNKGIKVSQTTGDKNGIWKGNEVGYVALHGWIRRQLGSANICSFNPDHKSKVFEYANISGAYLRDIDDFVSLCVKCHKEYDWIRAGKPARARNEKGQFICTR